MSSEVITIGKISKYLYDLGITSVIKLGVMPVLGIADINSASATDLSWIGRPDSDMLAKTHAGVVIVPREFEDLDPRAIPCENPRLAFIKAVTKFFSPPDSPAVRIADTALIGRGCVIGSEGFGHEKDLNGVYVRFPHFGGVRIEDHVEIGDHVHIQRGSLSDTVIKEHARIWHKANIGHNTYIGRRSIVLNGSIICGSVIVGNDVWIAPNVSIMNKMTIGANSIVGIGSVVTKHIPENEVWAGNPARKIGNRDAYPHIMRPHRR